MIDSSRESSSQPALHAPIQIPALPLVARMSLCCCLLLSFVLSARQVRLYWSLGPGVTDLRIFMTGVDLVKSGNGAHLYDFEVQQAAQISRYPQTKYDGLLPFNHVAYELLFYFPFASLSYRAAIASWAVLNLALLSMFVWFMEPYTRLLRAVTKVPTLLWILGFYPVMYALGEGQDSLIFLFFVGLSFHLCHKHRDFLSGFALSVGCFKFHLAIMIAFFVFLLPRRWRALSGFLVGVLLASVVSTAMVGPNFWHSYIRLLRAQETMTPWGFNAYLMPNLRGLLHLLLTARAEVGTIFVLTLVTSAALGAAVTWMIWRCSPQDDRLAYALAVFTTVLLSYHLHVQDLSLALLGILLVADWGIRNRMHSGLALFLMIGVGLMYAYRVAAEAFPALIQRGSILAVPLMLLWLMTVLVFSRSPRRYVSYN